MEVKPTARARVKILKTKGEDTWLSVTLTEGRKRQIREVAKTLGYPVKNLIRVRIGSIRLGRLGLGKWRHLNPREVARLKSAVRE